MLNKIFKLKENNTNVRIELIAGITEGIAFGFISYSLLKLISGRGRVVHWLLYFFSVLFLIRYIYLTR